MRRGIWIMQTCTARQLPTSRLRGWKISNLLQSLPQKKFTYKMCSVYLRLMLFCTANWIPLTISGSSGIIANSVTPIKYWNTQTHTGEIEAKLRFQICLWTFFIYKKKNTSGTCEMEELFSRGWMFSVRRSAQHAIKTVATISTARALHRDQWTTWWLAETQWTKKKKEICGTPKFSPLFILSYFKMTS